MQSDQLFNLELHVIQREIKQICHTASNRGILSWGLPDDPKYQQQEKARQQQSLSLIQ